MCLWEQHQQDQGSWDSQGPDGDDLFRQPRLNEGLALVVTRRGFLGVSLSRPKNPCPLPRRGVPSKSSHSKEPWNVMGLLEGGKGRITEKKETGL